MNSNGKARRAKRSIKNFDKNVLASNSYGKNELAVLTRSIKKQKATVSQKVVDITMIMNNKYDIKEDKKSKKPKTSDDIHSTSAPDSNSYLADADRPFTAEDAKNLSDLEGRIHAMSLEMSALLTERKQLLLVKKDPVMGVGRSAFIGNFFDLNKGCQLIRSNNLLPIEHDLTARVIEELFRASFDLEKVPKNNKERTSKKRGGDDDDTDDD